MRRFRFAWRLRGRSPLAGWGGEGTFRKRRKDLGAHRPRARKQVALAIFYVMVEEVQHGAFALDLFDHQFNAEPRHQTRQIRRVNVGRTAWMLAEQQARRHLDEAKATVGEVAWLEFEIADVIQGESGSPSP